tara:strand:+ start:9311 stop:9607 length:297 start_codon:yes stop_codon:yes gene_type:complete
MITTILGLVFLYFLSTYIIKHLKFSKADKKLENDKNFWMFTYDFKEVKKKSIFDRDSRELIQKRKKKNQLIVLLYLVVILIFIYTNLLITQILKWILN